MRGENLTIDAIFNRCIPEPNSGCWLWSGAVVRGGYGKIKVGGRSFVTSRLAYEIVSGPVDLGLDVDHLCHVPLCANPAHLEAVSKRENTRRRRPGRGLAMKCSPDPSYRARCVRGHEFDVIDSKGARRCRQCHAMLQRRYRRARKISAAALEAA
jgi:hypothetical protein